MSGHIAVLYCGNVGQQRARMTSYFGHVHIEPPTIILRAASACFLLISLLCCRAAGEGAAGPLDERQRLFNSSAYNVTRTNNSYWVHGRPG